MPLRGLASCVLILALCACAARTSHAPAAPPQPGPVAQAAVDAAAPSPPPPPDPRHEAVLAAWRAANRGVTATPSIVGDPIEYPEEHATTARVAAVVSTGDGSVQLVVTPIPHAAGQQAIATLSAPADAVAGLTARDVNGDRRSDVAVFLRRDEAVEGYASLQRYARFFTLVTTPEREMRSMDRAEVELLGVRDDASLAAAIPGLGRYEAPADGMSPARFLARLRYATPEEFRRSVAASGLRLCTDLPDRTGRRRKRCSAYPVARLTDALINGRIRRDLGQFVDILTDDTGDLTFPNCRREGQALRCNANRGGPAGVDWSLVGEGAAMRVIEVSPWAEST